MKNLLVLSLVLTLAVGTLSAQQRNQLGVASLVIDNQTATSGPIAVPIPRGSTVPLAVSGTPNQPFGIWYSTVGMRANGFIYAQMGPQLIDLDDSQPLRNLFAGFDPATLTTDATGQFGTNVTIATGTTIGTRLPVQGYVVNPAASWPIQISLTAASDVSIVPGVTTLPLNLTNNGNFRASFATYGLPDFPFYETSYNAVFINTDGNLTFNSGDGDFTPTPTEFHSGRPRIAPFWTDMDPAFGGNMRATFDPNGTFGPEMFVEWNMLPVWQNTGGRHTFRLRMYHLTGDIEIIQDAFNVQPIYDVLMGIGPGGNIRPPGVSPYPNYTDFSTFSVTNPKITQARESMWEWYGRTTMPFYTQAFDNVFDLTNRTVFITSLGAGFPGALYSMYTQ